MSPAKKEDYDIIVVGGGPSGCAFVRSLIASGSKLRVLLIEKEQFPRDKVCGDGLTYQAIPQVREVFPELKSLTPSAAFTSRQVFWYPPGRHLIREGQALDVIPRREFDHALWQATIGAGAEARENTTVTGLLRTNGRVSGVKVRDANGSRELSCRLVVGADGSRSILRRETGSTDDDYVIYALRQYVRGLPDSTEGLIFFLDFEYQGYFWIFPFRRNGERCANIGYGNATNHGILKERLSYYCRMPEVQRYLGAGQIEGTPAGFPLNLAKFKWTGRLNRRLWGPGYLLLGDAAALIHPLSGEGIAFSIASGRIAAQVLVDNQILEEKKGAAYERRILRRVRPSFLSLSIFCAIRLPMLLPRWLSYAIIMVAAFGQRLGLGIRPLPRMRALRNSIGFEGIILFVLLGALSAFWLIRMFQVSALPSPYGARAPIFAGIATTFCLLNAWRQSGGLFALIFFLFVSVSSLAVELAGCVTGNIFGVYHYNIMMPGQLFGLVPVVVPFVWFIISYLAFAATSTLLPTRASILTQAAVATVLFVAYDLVADPNHLYRGGWSYPHGGIYYGIPFQNFITWGLLGFLSFLFLGIFQQGRASFFESEILVPFAVIAYIAVMLHEGLFAFLIAGHSGAGTIAFAAAAVLSILLLRRLKRRSINSPNRVEDLPGRHSSTVLCAVSDYTRVHS